MHYTSYNLYIKNNVQYIVHYIIKYMIKLVLLSKMKNKNVRHYTFEDLFIKNCLNICIYIYIHILNFYYIEIFYL